jgi:hypothetical protein
MTDSDTESPRYLWRTFVMAPLVSGLLGSLVVGVALTGGASPLPLNPAMFLLVAVFALPIAFAHMLFYRRAFVFGAGAALACWVGKRDNLGVLDRSHAVCAAIWWPHDRHCQ